MARLTISDAARVAGVAHAIFHRAIRAGRLSVDPDGHVDTAELLCAGDTFQQSTRHSLEDATGWLAVPPLGHPAPPTQPGRFWSVSEAVTHANVAEWRTARMDSSIAQEILQ